MNENDFVTWVEEERNKREWSRTKLADKMKMSQPQVSRVLNREQSPGKRFCAGISEAYNMPLELVYRRAGLLDAKDEKTELIEEINHELQKLTPTEQEMYLRLLKAIPPGEKKVRYKPQQGHT